MPWETIREDYLLSNVCRAEEIERRLAELRGLAAENRGISPEQVGTTNMEAFYRLEGSYIDASLDQIVEEHGSIEAYLREGLGLGDHELERLRAELLEQVVVACLGRLVSAEHALAIHDRAAPTWASSVCKPLGGERMATTGSAATESLPVDRRTWLKGAAATLAAPSILTGRQAFAADALPVTAAGYRFDRTAALFDGRIGIEGCAATFVESGIGDMNTHAFSSPGTRELTEIGLHPYMLAHANEGFRDYVLLPVFLLRQFRHKSVFIRTDRGITTPEDLRGRRLATPGYSSTSLTWIRAIFEDEYGLAPSDVEWVVAAGDFSAAESGAMSAQENRLPEGISITSGPPGLDESELLTSGEVDAMLPPRAPSSRAIRSSPACSRTTAEWSKTTTPAPASSGSCMRWRSERISPRRTPGW